MKLAAIYIFVVLVWSSTPLAIYISNADLNFMLSLALRMSLGAALVVVCLAIMRQRFLNNRKAWLVGFFGALGVFPNMPLVYWSTQHIPTGLVSLLFSSTPFFVGIMSKLLMGESIGGHRLAGICVAFVGLVLVFFDQMRGGLDSILGVLAMLGSAFIFSTSSVLVKKADAHIPPLQQGGCAMIIALPGLWISWYFLDGTLPEMVRPSSLYALLYLVVVGSVLGFGAYYFLLKRMTASSVSLISMISPVLAIVLGVVVNGELVKPMFIVGAIVVLTGLSLYSGIWHSVARGNRVQQA